jgi:Protoglobin
MKGLHMSNPHGYDYDIHLAPSPVSLAELGLLKATLLWSDDDTSALHRAGLILGPRVEDILDVWYGFVASSPHLVVSFAGSDGEPDPAYLGAVRLRFAKWIVDVCERDYDQRWLDYQHEVAMRHHVAKKNVTDSVASTATEIPMRYLVAFIVPLTLTIRSFLAAGAANNDDLDSMYNAWFKAVSLTAILWTQPYSASW